MEDNKCDEDDGKSTVETESHNKTGKKPRIEPRSMTDEEYEEIFAAVLEVQLSQHEEKNTSPDVKEDDFDAILHEEIASEAEDGDADDKAEEEEAEEEDDRQEGDELDIDDLPPDVRASVVQMTNEVTPCTSDAEDGASQETPVLPPKMLLKKHTSSSKKQMMKPKQLKFDKNRDNEEDGDSKSITKSGHVPSKCEQSKIVHKKKPHSNSMADTCRKDKSNNETLVRKETSNDSKKRTSDDVVRSKKAGSVGNNQHTNKKTKKVSKKQKMQKRKLEERGTWVQCTSTFCMKWRYLPHVHDPSSLPDAWLCHMNTDKKYNNCDVPQLQFDQREHDENYIFMTYTEGSVVWARMDGYPWWPAMVEIDPDYEDFYECRGPSNKATHYHVVFFDDKVSRAWLSSDRLRPFSEIDEPEKVLIRGVNHSKGVNAAKSKALQALDMPLKERLLRYSFSVRYSGKWGINVSDGDSQNSQSSSSSCPRVMFAQKKSQPRKEDLETSELADDDVEDMLNDAEEIVRDAEEIYDFVPSENEDVMSDYEPEKPKKTKEKKKKKAVQEKAPGEDKGCIKKKKKRKQNEDGNEKKCKRQKPSIQNPTAGSKEKRKVKSNSGVDAPKVKPSFQPPKLEKARPPVIKSEFDSDVFTMELGCDTAESQPKTSTVSVKKSVTKKNVNKDVNKDDDKENIDPDNKIKTGSTKAKLPTHKEKTLTKPKVAVKPKFVAPNAHTLAKVKDSATDAAKDKELTTDVAKKTKTFAIKKQPANKEIDDGKTTENSKDTNVKTNNKTSKKSVNQNTAEKSGTKKTKDVPKTPEVTKKKTLSPKQPVDDITDDLDMDLEDKLFPDLELTSAEMNTKPGFDGDEDSEPFEVEPETGVVADVTGADKLNSLNAGYDSDPMEFEE